MEANLISAMISPKNLGHSRVALEECAPGVSRGHDVLHRRDQHPAVREQVRPWLDLEVQPPAVPSPGVTHRITPTPIRERMGGKAHADARGAQQYPDDASVCVGGMDQDGGGGGGGMVCPSVWPYFL